MAAGSPLFLSVTEPCLPTTPPGGLQVRQDCPGSSLCACPWCACSSCFSPLFSLSLGACDPPTRLQFAELNEEHRNAIGFSVGKTVQYTCNPGYAKVPGMSPTITCLENGVWSENGFCTPAPLQGSVPTEHMRGSLLFLHT
uniref:Sushi domain-containing protein n=1 Tax=Catharus ustulatus TaxID=91951 RepID=A0A8C3V9X8_CATUS